MVQRAMFVYLHSIVRKSNRCVVDDDFRLVIFIWVGSHGKIFLPAVTAATKWHFRWFPFYGIDFFFFFILYSFKYFGIAHWQSLDWLWMKSFGSIEFTSFFSNSDVVWPCGCAKRIRNTRIDSIDLGNVHHAYAHIQSEMYEWKLIKKKVVHDHGWRNSTKKK